MVEWTVYLEPNYLVTKTFSQGHLPRMCTTNKIKNVMHQERFSLPQIHVEVGTTQGTQTPQRKLRRPPAVDESQLQGPVFHSGRVDI